MRRLAAHVLSRHAEALATLDIVPLLSDRLSFQTLRPAMAESAVPTDALQQVHYQGVLMPELINRGATEELLGILRDRGLTETARMGAIESLARLADVAMEAALKTVGEDEAEEETVRRAAWRGVKRSRRLRQAAVDKKAALHA